MFDITYAKFLEQFNTYYLKLDSEGTDKLEKLPKSLNSDFNMANFFTYFDSFFAKVHECLTPDDGSDEDVVDITGSPRHFVSDELQRVSSPIGYELV